MSRIKLFIPVFIFVGLGFFLYLGLGKNPQDLPSVTVGKPLPDFSLPTLDSNLVETATKADLLGEPFLINIWATWCPTCLVEHPYLYELSTQNVKILGVNYKDDAEAAKRWLKKYKNPYAVTVFDQKGRFGFDLGVTGAPETFLVNAIGDIVYRHVGVVDSKVWDAHFKSAFVQPETDNNTPIKSQEN